MNRYPFILIIAPLIMGSCNSLPLGKSKEGHNMAFPDSWSITSKNYSGRVKSQWLKGLGDKRVLEVTQEALKNNYDLQALSLIHISEPTRPY